MIISTPILVIIDTIVITGLIILFYAMWEVRNPVIDYAELKYPDKATRDMKRFVKRDIYLHEHDAVHTEAFLGRVLYFSDLHAEYCFYKSKSLSDLIVKEHKKNGLDAVIFGGDIIDDPKYFELGKQYLLEIASTCKANNIPFIGVPGNHDVELTNEQLTECGFVNLAGKYTTLQGRIDGRLIAFSGVGDSGRHNRVWETPTAVPSTFDGKTVAAHVLLAHNPDNILHIDPQSADGASINYVMSGHIHAGQIRTPLGIEFHLLRRHDVLPRKYKVISGIYAGMGVGMFVSAGLGNVLFPFRIGARPEITVIEIYDALS